MCHPVVFFFLDADDIPGSSLRAGAGGQRGRETEGPLAPDHEAGPEASAGVVTTAAEGSVPGEGGLQEALFPGNGPQPWVLSKPI